MLAELGDDRTRFADARALKAYAGAAPITRASGKSLLVHHRKVKNQRLAAAGYVWAFAAREHRGPGSITTGDAPKANGTPARYATPSTGCSAACSTACRKARPMTSSPPSLLVHRCDSTKRTERRPTPLPAVTGRSGTRTPYRRPRHHHEHGGAMHQRYRGRR
ncbi:MULTISPECIES: transposase [unclassified Nonomuraea]|uniref:transposase n=1 Tax=unclassified Nonomuraea TaxID=2593643 RepID=UPI0033ED022D